MSPSEIKSLYPYALGPNPSSDSEVMVQKKIAIFGQYFDVLFSFASHKLAEVTLMSGSGYSSDILGQHLDSPEVEFDLIRDELEKKYGRPIHTEDTSAFKVLSKDIDFLNDGISIRLKYMDTTKLSSKGDVSVQVTYFSPISGGSPL
jgi:hypothetical protein